MACFVPNGRRRNTSVGSDHSPSFFARLDSSSVAFSKEERVHVESLAGLHPWRLPSDREEDSIKGFLTALEDLAIFLDVDTASRAHRSRWTRNYQDALPGQQRHYRIDLLLPCLDESAAVWTNGEEFRLSDQTMKCSGLLRDAWTNLGFMLHEVTWERMSSRSDLLDILITFDLAWANFEHYYISDLINIESRARDSLMQAVILEERLTACEADPSLSDQAQTILEELTAAIAHLNSVANSKRKGRGDLTVDVLNAAYAALAERRNVIHMDGTTSMREQTCEGGRDVVHILAADVEESFAALRQYLRQVRANSDFVHPQLYNNRGLVARLVDWEVSWELGAQQLLRPGLLSSLRHLVREVVSAQRLVQPLAAMFDTCDAELFLVLPRLVWLCCLMEPALHQEFLTSLLPHLFAGGDGRIPQGWDREMLKSFAALFENASQLLEASDAVSFIVADPSIVHSRAWTTMVCRAISGPCVSSEQKCSGVGGEVSVEAASALEQFMRDLERWSMELQRHCPDDWNNFTGLLVQCVGGKLERQRGNAAFVV